MHRLIHSFIVAAMTVGMAMLPLSGVSADKSPPTLKMLSVIRHMNVERFPEDTVVFFLSGVYLANAGSENFELDANRASDGAIDVWQVRRTQQSVERIRRLPRDPRTSFFEGVGGFLRLTVRDSAGAVVSNAEASFCPNGGEPARTNGSGPVQPTFPYDCGGERTLRAAWGIDRGWSVPILGLFDAGGLPDGDYTMRFQVVRRYARALAMDPSTTSATVALTLTTIQPPGCEGAHSGCVGLSRARAQSSGPAGVPSEGGGVPDLIPLPADQPTTEAGADGRDRLIFDATIWNRGSGPLVVEGFRSGDAQRIPATQHIYERGRLRRSVPVGEFVYDPQPGHKHWHFSGFAQYDLLSESGERLVLSDKMSFCLTSTDMIDTTLLNATWQPDKLGFGGACGSEAAIWLREVLPVGWGDTYQQNLPGQSFDITDLPNGRYTIRVMADPTRQLQESSYDNNTAFTTIELGGEPGNRTVTTV